MFEELEGLFASSLVAETESEADDLIRKQRQAWPTFLYRIKEGLKTNQDEDIIAAINKLALVVQNAPGIFARPHNPKKGFVVSGKVPLLVRDDAEVRQLIATNPYDVLGAVLSEGGQDLVDLLRSMDVDLEHLTALYGPTTQIPMTRYLLRKTESGLRQQVVLNVQAALAEQTSMLQRNTEASADALKQLQAKHDQLLTKFNQVGSDADMALTSLHRQGAQRIDQAASEWSEFLNRASQDIEAAKALAFEGAALKTARKIWAAKKTKHSFTFGLGLIALASLVGAGVLLLIAYWQEVLAAIPRNTQGEPISSFLLFIIVPVVATAWVLRIFAKWITNSLTLGEDAEQRRAMLETYFSLVGNKDAKMEPSDRILILNAIFRPLPGHQSEDVAPPTLLDLAKDALSGKKG